MTFQATIGLIFILGTVKIKGESFHFFTEGEPITFAYATRDLRISVLIAYNFTGRALETSIATLESHMEKYANYPPFNSTDKVTGNKYIDLIAPGVAAAASLEASVVNIKSYLSAESPVTE